METRFTTQVSRQLRAIATPDEIAALRRAVNDAEQGHRVWYLAFLARILASLNPKETHGPSGR